MGFLSKLLRAPRTPQQEIDAAISEKDARRIRRETGYDIKQLLKERVEYDPHEASVLTLDKEAYARFMSMPAAEKKAAIEAFIAEAEAEN